MGCGSSSTDDALLARLRSELEESKNKSNEQQNLLRFKIEVLVNMLAMEEKKSETIEKRVETLKGLLQSEGITEQMLTSVMMNAEKADLDTRASVSGSTEKGAPFRNVGWVDLEGPLSRTQEEFDLYRADIIPAFAGEDGKVVAVLRNDEFMKQLYQVTEKLSKADLQIIALRFSDGSGFVSIPEFLEFFTTPAKMRMAKAATAAVRMSLDLLQLTADEEYLQAQGDEDEVDADLGELSDEDVEMAVKAVVIPKVLSSHLTNNLDRGVRKLLAMWVHVKKELEVAFVFAQGDEESLRDQERDNNTINGNDNVTLGSHGALLQVISVDHFKAALLEKCGVRSGVLSRAETEGKIQLNRTGRPVSTALPQKTESGNNSPTKGAADSTADGKGTAMSKSEDRKGTSDMKREDSRASLQKGNSTSQNALSGKASEKSGDTAVALPTVEPLSEVDVDMLAERFELDRCVHFGHFVQYFNELHAAIYVSRRKHVTLPNVPAASPFLVSSEWQKLRSSAVLQHYATQAPPPAPVPQPPTPVPQAPAAEPPVAPVAPTTAPLPPAKPLKATPAPTPAPAPAAEPKPAAQLVVDSKADAKKGIDAADFKPGDLPAPVGVEIVEPGKGMFCCGGGGARAQTKNQPEPLVLPNRADDKAAWVDPADDKGAEGSDQDSAEGKSQSADSNSGDDLPKVDRGFNTPVDRSKSKPKLSFQPRRVVREGDSAEEDVQRTGLGKKGQNEVPAERGAQRRNHFHRRDPADLAPAVRNAGLESDSGSDVGNTRPQGRARADSSGEGFSAPRAADTRWK